MPLLWNTEKKIIVFHIPKSGGTSLYRYLTEIDGNFIQFWNGAHMKFSYIHCSASTACSLFQEYTGYSPCFCITVVRNPYDRFLSAFLHTHLMGLHNYQPNQEGCLQFIEEIKTKSLTDSFWKTDLGTFLLPQTTFLPHSSDQSSTIVILHLETIKEDLTSLLISWNYPSNKIQECIKFDQIHNKSPISISKEEWYQQQPLIKEWVALFYQDDFSRFQYQI